MSSPQSSPPNQSSRALFKDILQGSGMYSIALIAQRMASLILVPITTRCLTTADYGILGLLEQTSFVLTVLLGGNFSLALGYFYVEANSPDARRPVIGTAILGAGAVGLAAGLLCWPFAAPMSRLIFGSDMAAGYLRLHFAVFMPTFVLEALFCWLRVADRPGMFVMGAIIRLLVTVAGIVTLVAVYRMRIWGVVWTMMAAIVVTALILMVYCFRRERPTFERHLFVRMAKFAAPIGLSWLAMFIVDFGDRFILAHYRLFSDMGIYDLAYKFGILFSALYGNFSNYWNAQVFQIMKRDDADAVFPRLLTYVFVGTSFCALGVVVCARPALTLFVGQSFRRAAVLVPVIVAAYYVNSLSQFLRALFMAAGRPGYDAACSWLGAAVCLAGYLILIPRYGIWGAAVATLISFVVMGVVSVVWTYRLCHYRVESGRIVKIVIALAAGVTPFVLLPRGAVTGQIGAAALSIAAFPAVLWFLRFPTRGEMEVGRSAIRRFAARWKAVPQA
jgi:O-antigen/teichoic acid export membrane protein